MAFEFSKYRRKGKQLDLDDHSVTRFLHPWRIKMLDKKRCPDKKIINILTLFFNKFSFIF